MIFDAVDEDGSGLLDREEMGLLLRQMGKNLTTEQLDDAMDEMDEDGSNGVDFEEFKKWWTSQGGHT